MASQKFFEKIRMLEGNMIFLLTIWNKNNITKATKIHSRYRALNINSRQLVFDSTLEIYLFPAKTFELNIFSHLVFFPYSRFIPYLNISSHLICLPNLIFLIFINSSNIFLIFLRFIDIFIHKIFSWLLLFDFQPSLLNQPKLTKNISPSDFCQ